MKADYCVILAAGNGGRMNTSKPAVLMPVCGRPLVEWTALVAKEACISKPVVVEGPGREMEAALGDGFTYVVQPEAIGEIDALMRAIAALEGSDGKVLVLHANNPFIEKAMLDELINECSGNGAAMLAAFDDILDESVRAGAWCFTRSELEREIKRISPRATIREAECLFEVSEVPVDPIQCTAAVDRIALIECQRMMNGKLLFEMMESGVSIMDPDSTYLEYGVSVGRDTIIWPGVTLTGRTVIGENCIIKNGCTLNDTQIGDGCELHYVVSNGALIGDGVKIGPFVNIRPGTVIADGCKIGDFMEIKNSTIGRGTKLPHLSYVGDADIGERVNLGCGSVFVNYDGFKKHRTTVGNDVFIGCQTNLIAPVNVGDNAYTAAGSTISRDVPAGAMAFARARQENKEGYVERFKALKSRE